MHPDAPDSHKQKWHERLVRSRYFLGALLFHLILFLLVATLVIWKEPPPPPTYEFSGATVKLPPPPPQAPSSGAAANNPQFEPQPVVVPVVTPPSMVTTVNSSAFKVDASKILKQSLSHLSDMMPQGSGLTSGGGNGLSGLGTGYGTGTGNANGFVGTFYDLKQTPDRKPTNIAESPFESRAPETQMDPQGTRSPAMQNGLKLLRSFVKTWDMNMLNDYYKAPDDLYTTQICIPVTPSPDATQAFHVESAVRARRWIVIYQAKVIPPESGRFRFIGFADDFMVVRFDGKNVLDASLTSFSAGEELDPSASVHEDLGIGPENKPLRCGIWIDMQGGIAVDMQVLIGEGPGGVSGFLLMIQKQGDGSPKGDYPVFQLQDTDIPDMSKDFTFSKKKMLFQVSH